MISFIIPAHNEESLIGRTLSAIRASASWLGVPYEIIVVNDASTDQTAAIAKYIGARVVEVNNRQIAATRNAGARAAVGDVFVFVDADTMVTKRALRAAVRALSSGAVGGGCYVRFDGQVPVYARILERVLPAIVQAFGLAAGCFLFCKTSAYLAAGGFDETMDWGEEVAFSSRLKCLGRFVLLHEFVITSPRKLRTHSPLELLKVGLRLALSRPNSQQHRQALEYWYGQRSASH